MRQMGFQIREGAGNSHEEAFIPEERTISLRINSISQIMVFKLLARPRRKSRRALIHSQAIGVRLKNLAPPCEALP
jgi:hypothetical protein